MFSDFFCRLRPEPRRAAEETEESVARSSRPTTLVAWRDPRLGKMPAVLELGHKHLEKSHSGPLWSTKSERAYQVPVDLWALMLGQSYVAEVESIEFVYRTGGK